ncbi:MULTISPECIES: hypothetical protein [unclassified Paraburkholderia]|uniref:hypothetical protein n=1 Tax=unclassified Paraburkholderia TaxID=2615204 RepID=UPI002AB716C1|nr:MULTISPECIES: hypothetical protein [unclassified Paraburkholderia]
MPRDVLPSTSSIRSPRAIQTLCDARRAPIAAMTVDNANGRFVERRVLVSSRRMAQRVFDVELRDVTEVRRWERRAASGDVRNESGPSVFGQAERVAARGHCVTRVGFECLTLSKI